MCLLADEPLEFAAKVVQLIEHPEQAARIARRARVEVETNWDVNVAGGLLAESYRELIRAKRFNSAAAGTFPSERADHPVELTS